MFNHISNCCCCHAAEKPCISECLYRERDHKMLIEIQKGQNAMCNQLRIISSKVNGDYTPPNQRKSANERLVQAAIDKYWNLIKNGTPERDALAMACHAVENASGLGGYKSFESFRNVVSREVKKSGHSLVESRLTLPID